MLRMMVDAATIGNVNAPPSRTRKNDNTIDGTISTRNTANSTACNRRLGVVDGSGGFRSGARITSVFPSATAGGVWINAI